MIRCGAVYKNGELIYAVGPFANTAESEEWLNIPINDFCIKKIYRSKAEMIRDWHDEGKKLDKLVPFFHY